MKMMTRQSHNYNELFSLPVEVVIKIIEYLDSRCIVHLSLSCKYLYLICTQPIYIRTIQIQSWESLYTKALCHHINKNEKNSEKISENQNNNNIENSYRIFLPQNVIKQELVGRHHRPCWRLVNGHVQYKLRNQCDWDIPKPFQGSEWSEWDWSEKDPIPADLQCYDPLQQYKDSVDRGRQRLDRIFNNINGPRKHKKKSLMMIEIDERIRLEKERPSTPSTSSSSTSNNHEKNNHKVEEKNNSSQLSERLNNMNISEEETMSRKKIFEEAARIAKSRFLKVFSNGETIKIKSPKISPTIPKLNDKSNKSRRNSSSKEQKKSGANSRESYNDSDDSPAGGDSEQQPLITPFSDTVCKRKTHRSSRGQKLLENFRRSSKELDGDFTPKAKPLTPKRSSVTKLPQDGDSLPQSLIVIRSRPNSPRGINNSFKKDIKEDPQSSNTTTTTTTTTATSSKSRPLSPAVTRKEDIIIPRLALTPQTQRKQCRSISPRSLLKESAQKKKNKLLYLKRSFTETPPSTPDEPSSNTPLISNNTTPITEVKSSKSYKKSDKITTIKKSNTSGDIFGKKGEQIQWDDLLKNLDNLEKKKKEFSESCGNLINASEKSSAADERRTILLKVKTKSRDRSPNILPLRGYSQSHPTVPNITPSPRTTPSGTELPPLPNTYFEPIVQSAPTGRRRSRKDDASNHRLTPSDSAKLYSHSHYTLTKNSPQPNSPQQLPSSSPAATSPPSNTHSPSPPASSTGSAASGAGSGSGSGGGGVGGGEPKLSSKLPKSLGSYVTLKTLSERRRASVSRDSSPFNSPNYSPRLRKRTVTVSDVPQKSIDMMDVN